MNLWLTGVGAYCLAAMLTTNHPGQQGSIDETNSRGRPSTSQHGIAEEHIPVFIETAVSLNYKPNGKPLLVRHYINSADIQGEV
jgi:hypothetical protein